MDKNSPMNGIQNDDWVAMNFINYCKKKNTKVFTNFTI